MPKRTRVMVIEEHRKALPDGRVEHVVNVGAADGAKYTWEHVCGNEPDCDHEPAIKMLVERLPNYDTRVYDLNAMVGGQVQSKLVTAVITDCNIQIHGPDKWVFYLAWNETADGRTEPRVIEQPYSDPAQCPTPADAEKMLVAEVGKRNAALVKAKEVESFKNG